MANAQRGTTAVERRAALFGVAFAANQRAQGQGWPSRAERFRPMSVARACDLLAPSRASGPDAPAHHAARRAAVRTLLARGTPPEDARVQMLTQPEERPSMTVFAHAVRSKGRKRQGAAAGGSKAAAEGGATSAEVAAQGGLAAGPVNEPEMTFDRETYVSRATVPGYEMPVTEEGATALLEATDPRKWAAFGSEVFKCSDPGTWRDGHWQAGPWAERTDGDLVRTGGELREVVQWSYNESEPGEIENILVIDELTFSNKSKGWPRKTSYRYHLRQCVQSRLVMGWQWGGIDVDNGETTIEIRQTDAGLVAAISAWKEIRYANPSDVPPELIDVLNFTTPALLGLFMGELVFDGPRRFAVPGSPEKGT